MNEITEVTQGIDLTAIEYSDLAPSTKHKYTRSIERYENTGQDFNDIDALIKYANSLTPASRGQFKAALTLLAKDLELKAKAGATPENVNQVQAVVYRLEAITESVKVKKSTSQKLGKWISAKQVSDIYDLARAERNTLKSKRDLVLFKLLFKTGCRREEAAKIEFSDLTQRSINGRTVTIVQIHGKGKKERAISLDSETAELLAAWHTQVGDGPIIRRIKRGGILAGKLNPASVRYLVQQYGERIGEPELSAHDTRRTFAELLRQAGVGIEIISRLLGHESIETTMRYLDLNGDTIKTVPGDYIP